MYDAAIPFNAVNYASFQPMLEAIGQYGVGYKGPNFYDVRVTNLKKELALTKCETPENSNFLKNGKIVISIKIRNFSRSWMMKRISPLESSREI